MKWFVFCCMLLLCRAVGAQKLDKEQEKVWREKLNKISVEEFKAIVEANSFLPVRISKAQKELEETDALLKAKDEEVNFLRQKIAQLEKELANKSRGVSQPITQEPSESISADLSNQDDFSKGVVFRLQVAASDRVSLLVSNQYDLRVEQEGNLKKYTLGNFRTYEKAEVLKNCLPSLGIKGAWIVAYKDGVRVSLKEVR